MEVSERSAFLDCVHLIHADYTDETPVTLPLINSAHLSGWYMARLMDAPKKTILLTRDPADIVISRTFRKADYKKEFKQLSDDEFLRKNLSYVKNFFETSSNNHADRIVRFEDMREDLGAVVKSIAANFDHPISKKALKATVAELGYVSREKARRGSTKTNVYQGPIVNVPDEVRLYIKGELEDLRATLGYGS